MALAKYDLKLSCMIMLGIGCDVCVLGDGCVLAGYEGWGKLPR